MSDLTTFQMIKKHRGAFYVSAAVNVGSILFGFDTGVAGATVALASFKKDFELVDASNPTKLADTSGNIVALLNLGALLGCMVPPFVSKWIGRKHLLAMAGFFFLVGGILQTAAQPPALAMMYGGRFIAGFGVGMISNTAPVFVAESAPKQLRGVMMAAFELFLVSGGMIAYWSVYGCSVNLPATSTQWRVTLSLQIFLAAVVLVSAFFIPESPRWLAKKGDWDQCIKALCFLRGANAEDPEIIEEVAEIRAQIEEELAVTNGRSIRELFIKQNFQRLCWGLGVALFAMWGGHNAMLYYGPSVFAQIGFTSQNSSLLASGVFTVVKFVCTIFFIAGTVHFVKRKTLLIVGGFFMGAFLFALGAVLATHPASAGSNESASGKAMMALIYLFVVAYSLSWGPVQWIYMGEIFPTRIRDYGMAACAMMIWVMNYVVSKIAPIAILNIGWKTWMIFGTMNIAACIFSFFLPETKDLSLEEMDVLFGVVAEGVRAHDIELQLGEKGIVESVSGSNDVEETTKHA